MHKALCKALETLFPFVMNPSKKDTHTHWVTWNTNPRKWWKELPDVRHY